MREYIPKKNRVSLGEACQKMYQMTWFDDEPVKMVWNDVEVIMRSLKRAIIPQDVRQRILGEVDKNA